MDLAIVYKHWPEFITLFTFCYTFLVVISYGNFFIKFVNQLLLIF